MHPRHNDKLNKKLVGYRQKQYIMRILKSQKAMVFGGVAGKVIPKRDIIKLGLEDSRVFRHTRTEAGNPEGKNAHKGPGV